MNFQNRPPDQVWCHRHVCWQPATPNGSACKSCAEEAKTTSTFAFRVEHGAEHITHQEAAKRLVALATKLDIHIVCNINRMGDMFAFPHEDPDVVYKRWKSVSKVPE